METVHFVILFGLAFALPGQNVSRAAGVRLQRWIGNTKGAPVAAAAKADAAATPVAPPEY